MTATCMHGATRSTRIIRGGAGQDVLREDECMNSFMKQHPRGERDNATRTTTRSTVIHPPPARPPLPSAAKAAPHAPRSIAADILFDICQLYNTSTSFRHYGHIIDIRSTYFVRHLTDLPRRDCGIVAFVIYAAVHPPERPSRRLKIVWKLVMFVCPLPLAYRHISDRHISGEWFVVVGMDGSG